MPMPGPISKPSAASGIGVERRGQRDDRALLRARRARRRPRSAARRPAHPDAPPARTQQLGAGRAAVGRDGCRLDQADLRRLRIRGRAASAARAFARSRRGDARQAAGFEAQRVGAREPGLESLMSPTRNCPSASFGGLRGHVRLFGRQVSRRSATSASKNASRTSATRRRPLRDELLGGCLGVEPRVLDPLRPLPELIDGERRRELELLRPPRKEQGEHGIAEQAGLDQVGAGEAQRRERDLKVGVVPERDGDRFVEGEAVVEGRAGWRRPLGARHWQATRVDTRTFGNASRDARAIRRHRDRAGRSHTQPGEHERKARASIHDRILSHELAVVRWCW